jgi:hypothetical protein
MEMVGLKADMRPYRGDRLGEALGVVREGRSDMEAEVFASLQKLPGILTIFRRRFMGVSGDQKLWLNGPVEIVV